MDFLYTIVEFVPTVCGRFLRHDCQLRGPQFDGFDGREPSISSVYWLSGLQMTTFHPLPKYHPVEQVAMFLLRMDWSGLFLKPG